MDGEQDDDERDGDAGGCPQPGAAALFAVIDEQRQPAEGDQHGEDGEGVHVALPEGGRVAAFVQVVEQGGEAVFLFVVGDGAAFAVDGQARFAAWPLVFEEDFRRFDFELVGADGVGAVFGKPGGECGRKGGRGRVRVVAEFR